MRKGTKNHLPTSKEMETVMKRHLSAKYTQTVADDIWKNILTQYEAFTKDLPDLGDFFLRVPVKPGGNAAEQVPQRRVLPSRPDQGPGVV